MLRCRKCVIPQPHRLVDVLMRQRARGFAMALVIPLAELRDHAVKAKRRGRAVTVSVKPLPGAEYTRQ